jgi:hypothetical protein
MGVKLAVILGLLFTLLLLGTLILLQILGFSFSNQVLFSNTQPAAAHSHHAGYQVDVIHQQLALGARNLILIHRTRVPDYGYAVDYPGSLPDLVKPISRVAWESKGVTLEFPDQTVWFIPAANFTGGR